MQVSGHTCRWHGEHVRTACLTREVPTTALIALIDADRADRVENIQSKVSVSAAGREESRIQLVLRSAIAQ